ncbi:unnamed protein product [Musa textilis]
MAAALSLNGPVLCGNPSPKGPVAARRAARRWRRSRWWGPVTLPHGSGLARRPPSAGSRPDDSSAPDEMTVERALKLLGVSEGASFDDILRAKSAVLASCKDDMEAASQVRGWIWSWQNNLLVWVDWSHKWIPLVSWSVLRPSSLLSFKASSTTATVVCSFLRYRRRRLKVSRSSLPSPSPLSTIIMLFTMFQVEAAYDMLLMQRLSQRRAGKVANGNIRYADIRPIRSPGTGALPEWLQKTVKNIPVSVESPSTNSLGIQAGVYGALMVLTFVSGSSPASAGPYTGADVPGLILATSFGASLYFLSKKRINLGK